MELLAAAQGCDFHAPLVSSAPLEAVRRLVRSRVAHLDEDRHLHPDILAGIELVRSGYTEQQIGKLWSGNLLRVWGEVEQVAKQIQGR